MSELVPKHWYRSRRYLHFDRPVGVAQATRIVGNPNEVARHSFFPFISYSMRSEKLRRDPVTGQLRRTVKARPIAYAAHVDSHIYAFYNSKLSEIYEAELRSRSLTDCVLAFRPIGKSNIDIAHEAFSEIESRQSCFVAGLDIESFFDNVAHNQLKQRWISILGTADLPADHYAIFKSITQYSHVDRELLYDTFGISKSNPRKGRSRVCSPPEFRQRIRRGGLIQKNGYAKGIPQGSPISALLSNIYMLEFDTRVHRAVTDWGGRYFRYCDDILCVVPRAHRRSLVPLVRSEIRKLDLDINLKKNQLCTFQRSKKRGLHADKPLQYLGFIFDGQRTVIRSAALARYSERMKSGVRIAKNAQEKANALRVARGQAADPLFKQRLFERYSHLGNRTFIRYGLRAAKTLGSPAIRKQLKRLWTKLINEIER